MSSLQPPNSIYMDAPPRHGEDALQTAPAAHSSSAEETTAVVVEAEQPNVTPIPSDFPPVVYLPCAEPVSDPAEARIDMRQTRDGRTALLAYSALDRLHKCCGHNQAWMLMPTANLAALQATQPFQLLLLDVVIPVERRRRSK